MVTLQGVIGVCGKRSFASSFVLERPLREHSGRGEQKPVDTYNANDNVGIAAVAA
jgi:hypothetical protein